VACESCVPFLYVKWRYSAKLGRIRYAKCFLFDEVIEDSQAQQDMLSIIFGRQIPIITQKREEVPEFGLNDGAVRIFLNTRGENAEKVSEELIDLLYYLEHTTDTAANGSESERIHRIHERVRKVKSSEEIGVKYMQAWEERYYGKEEAREEGRKKGIAEGKSAAF